MAAIDIYGATRAGILALLPQWQQEGSVLPGYEEIDTNGKFLLDAAADVGIALQRGGHGLAPTLTAGTYSYQRVSSLIEERAATRFATAVAHMMDPDSLDYAWRRSDAQLHDIEQGRLLGELDDAANQRNVIFKHGTTTRATILSRRRTAGDPM